MRLWPPVRGAESDRISRRAAAGKQTDSWQTRHSLSGTDGETGTQLLARARAAATDVVVVVVVVVVVLRGQVDASLLNPA